MKNKATLITLLILFVFCNIGKARLFVVDDLLKTVERSGRELAAGKTRKGIRNRLNAAIKNNPQSTYLELAKNLVIDLSTSIETTANSKYNTPLLDTTLPFHFIACSANWTSPLKQFTKKHPRDPMTAILSRDRSVIGSLLPQLSDRSPTRSYYSTERMPKIPRVCDMALLAIEFHSKCRFNSYASSGTLFHELPIEKRNKMIHHIERWWSENKGKSIAAGIRSQLPYTDFYGKVWIAKNLANLRGKEQKSNRKYSIEILRTLVLKNRGHAAACAAETLAELDDYSAVDIFYSRWKQLLNKPVKNSDSSYVVFYLTDYGTRRDWELLHTLAKREIEQGVVAGNARIWPALVNCNKAKTSLFAIPGLALALTQTRISGSRSFKSVRSQAFSYADLAVEYLQKLTKIDFGYRRDSSVKKRTAAIQKAQDWWNSKGSKQYTFDNIEAIMKKMANKASYKK